MVDFSEFFRMMWNMITGKNQNSCDEDWNLDEQFFNDMERWKEKHPDSTFKKVMEQVNKAIRNGRPFIQYIPDSPFPARSLVQGLGYLLQLGMKIASAKKEVYDFTMEVSAWISTVEASFRDWGKFKFGSQAKENLKLIRDLIKEICKWGWARLNDGRWASILNGFAISEEIRVFRERLLAAREILVTLQDINLALGVDEILIQIQAIKNLQELQYGQILDRLDEQKNAEDRQRFLERVLFPAGIQDTAYDKQGKLPCDPDTRVEILKVIITWVDDVSEGCQNFFWLTGDPGCGKSAITASLAKYTKRTGTLWAQFFINRNNEATTNPRVFFPSIARQMAEHASDSMISKTIYTILKDKPTLLDQLDTDQALDLFVGVVRVACDLDKSKAVVIVIDGLDETDRERLRDTAKIISNLFKEIQRPNAKVFISSRTDDEITRPFYSSLKSNEQHVKHIHLHTSDPSSVEDVSKYLFRNIHNLIVDKDLNWEVWPGEERFKTLCLRAAGLFIWAATVIKFFQEQLRMFGHERLDELLDVINQEGMSDVNFLYQTILHITYTTATGTATDEWAHETFRWVVGFIVALKEPLPIGDIGTLLNLRRTPTSNQVDIVCFVTNLRTVLIAGTEAITKDTIPRLHKSFVEYITSDRAEPRFRIDIPVVDEEIAGKCLQLVRKLRDNDGRASISSGSMQYAIKNWVRHLPNSETRSGVAIVGRSADRFSTIFRSTTATKNGFMTATGDYQTHMFEPTCHKFITNKSAIWAVAVSSDGQLIASGDQGGIIRVWVSHKLIGEPLKGHTDSIRSLMFLPNSHQVVSGSSDKSLRLWDCDTGHAIGSPLLAHTAMVSSIYTNGSLIISGSYDRTIRIWECDTRKLVGSSIKAGGYVDVVALSLNGQIVAGVGMTVCVWDVVTRQKVACMKGLADNVCSVAWSFDGSQIAWGGRNNTISLWDPKTGKLLNTQCLGLLSIAFSPDGEWIASGDSVGTVRIWNSRTLEPVDPPLKGHTSCVWSVAFSPDGHQVISGSDDHTVRIRSLWPKPSQRATTVHLMQHTDSTISQKGNPSVISACYSPDRTLYTTSKLDGQISIWNLIN